MPNSLGSSCTADVQGIDWKMTLAGFVFFFLLFFFFPSLAVSIPVPAVGVEALGSLSDEPSWGCWCSFLSLLPGARFSAGDVWDRLLLQLLPPSMGSSVFGKGKPGEGGMLVRRGSCFSGCACSNPALFPFNFSAKTMLVMGKAWCRILVCSLVRMAKLLESVERKSVL